MKYSFSCSDVGMNCGYEIRNASSEEELLEQLKLHARMSHGLSSIPNDMLGKIKKAIKRTGKYSFSCSSVGMNCGFEIINARSEEELLQQLTLHAKMSHKMSEIPEETLNAIKAKITVS